MISVATKGGYLPDETTRSVELIHLLLHRLWSHRCLLNIHFPQNDTVFLSSLLRLSKKSGHLYLDELNPEQGHQLLVHHKRARVVGQYRGVEIRFDAELEQVEYLDEIAVYCIKMPDRIVYRQQRDSYRVSIPQDTQIPIRIEFGQSAPLIGRVEDLSLGGLRCAVPQPAHFLVDENHCNIELRLPDSEPISCLADIKHIDYSENGQYLFLGISFSDIDNLDSRALANLLRTVERRWIRQEAQVIDDDPNADIIGRLR